MNCLPWMVCEWASSAFGGHGEWALWFCIPAAVAIIGLSH